MFTDIAAEIYSKSKGTVPAGVNIYTASAAGVDMTRVDITRANLRRPKGCYITLELPDFAQIDDKNDAYVLSVASQLRTLLPKDGTVLVAGIGSRAVSADALGPLTADKIFATRKLSKTDFDLRSVAAVSPGTAAGTGVAAAEQLRALVGVINPCTVLCVDSLFTSDPRRLGCSIQLSNAGLSPRTSQPITQQTLGVPVVAIGVPTVMQAHVKGKDEVVITLKDIDEIARRGAQLLSLAINKALQPTLKVGELEFLTS